MYALPADDDAAENWCTSKNRRYSRILILPISGDPEHPVERTYTPGKGKEKNDGKDTQQQGYKWMDVDGEIEGCDACDDEASQYFVDGPYVSFHDSFVRREIQRPTGIEPASSAWKAEVIAIIRQARFRCYIY